MKTNKPHVSEMSPSKSDTAIRQTVIVIAAYNEATVIADVVRDVRRIFHTVVVVDDGSTDTTAAAARDGGATVLLHPINLGQGAALQTGIRYAVGLGCSYVVTFDADGQHLPEDALRMVAKLAGGGLQVILGSRFMGSTESMTASRRMLLRAATIFTRLTTGLDVTDAHNGLRAMTREAAERIVIRQNRMAHASEILDQIAQLGLAYAEAPVTIRYTDYSKAKGQSGFGAFNILLDLLIARMRK